MITGYTCHGEIQALNIQSNLSMGLWKSTMWEQITPSYIFAIISSVMNVVSYFYEL